MTAVPVVLDDEGAEGFGFFAGIVGVLRETDDAVFGDAALDEVVVHQFGDSGAWAQAAAAGDYDGSQFLPE